MRDRKEEIKKIILYASNSFTSPRFFSASAYSCLIAKVAAKLYSSTDWAFCGVAGVQGTKAPELKRKDNVRN